MTIHLPAETAMALAVAMTDPRIDLMLKRAAAEQAVEDLIQFLDDTEGDPDLEENGDERDSSWPAVGSHAFGAATNEDDEDTHDAEWVNEDGGNITDEPHDPHDEGNEEHSLCWNFGKPYAATESNSPSGNGCIDWDEKQAIKAEVRAMLARVGVKPKAAPSLMISGPDGAIYRMGVV